jgi:diguanylate cyclase (GGDEF)-like protein/PAS domain S-box-containing protein
MKKSGDGFEDRGQRYSMIAWRLASCFLLVALASGFPYLFQARPIPEHLLWLANGVLLAYLLSAPSGQWLGLVSAGLAAQVMAGMIAAGHIEAASVYLAILNVSEALVGSILVRKRWPGVQTFTDSRFLLRFAGYAVLAAPMATGIAYALSRDRLGLLAGWTVFSSWTLAHGLGMAVTAPAILAFRHIQRKDLAQWRKQWILPALFAAIAILAFSQARSPLLLVLFPLMVLVLLRFRLEWSTVALFVVVVTSTLLTVRGRGPLAALASLDPAHPGLALQLFVAEGLLVLYSASTVVEHYKRSERKLEGIASLHALVTENSRDAIILTDLDGHRSYGSAAAEKIGGWRPEELLTEEGLETIHPGDRFRVREIIEQMRGGAEGAVMECRVQRHADAEYIWVEANLRMLRDPLTGGPTGVLNFVREISVRKLAELKLQEAYDAVEALSVTDPLTGLANRRRFDKCLAHEWRRGVRSKEPLSLLMVDADNFKKYNDTYGHPRGDNCLKQIAEAALDSVIRPADLVARFGGEEFVVVMPNTDNAGAMHIANLLCESVRNRQLPHTGNPPGIVTISLGCATMIPKLGMQGTDLIEMADKALYQAKQSGRNQVSNGSGTSDDAKGPLSEVHGKGEVTSLST